MSAKGIERVRRNVERFVERTSGNVTRRAVYTILSQGGAISDTLTPIDTSNLVNSRYNPRVDVQVGKVVGTVGYTAAYAGAVHEAPGTLKGLPRPRNRGNYWDPNAQPGFLREGFERLKPSIPRILTEAYRV